MKKTTILIIFLLVILLWLLISHGLLKGELKSVKKDNQRLLEQVNSLQDKIDIGKLNLEFSKLKDLFKNYKNGDPIDIINQINKINIEENKSTLYEIYKENSGEIYNAISILAKNYEDFLTTTDSIRTTIKQIDSEILEIENKLKSYNLKDYKRLDLRIIRRFDTDLYTGKGLYEAVNMNALSKVVIKAREDEVEVSNYYEKSYLVKYLGEHETTVTNSNAYRNWEETEYYKYYEVVPPTLNPYNLKKGIEKAKKTSEKHKSELIKVENKLIKKIEGQVIKCKDLIISKNE